MCVTPIACITGCVFSLKIRVGDSPCNYSVPGMHQGEQSYVRQSLRGNYRTCFRGGQNIMTAVVGNAPICQVYPVYGITGDGRAQLFQIVGAWVLSRGRGAREVGGN